MILFKQNFCGLYTSLGRHRCRDGTNSGGATNLRESIKKVSTLIIFQCICKLAMQFLISRHENLYEDFVTPPAIKLHLLPRSVDVDS